jgi:hypothetical protein
MRNIAWQAGLDAATKLFDVDKVDAAIASGGSSITIPIAEMAAPRGQIIMTSSSSRQLWRHCLQHLPLDESSARRWAIMSPARVSRPPSSSCRTTPSAPV